MQEDEKRVTEKRTDDTVSDKSPTDQHPDWHPFAVWKSQIRSDQMAATGEYRVLSTNKIADA